MSHLLLLAQAGSSGSPLSTVVLFAGVLAIVWFMMIRPQQKQIKQHRELISSLKKGDEVVTQGGILGKVTLVSDREVQLEIASGVKIRVLKTSVQGRAGVAPAPEEKSEKEGK